MAKMQQQMEAGDDLEFKFYKAPFEVKEVTAEGHFSGYASVFGVVDFDNDIVAAGAFKRSLREWSKQKRLPPITWHHDLHQPLGPFLSMEEDEKGLFVEGQLLIADVQKAREARALMQHKAVTGLSIGFMVRKAEFDERTKVRTIKDVDLMEVAIVTFPANDKARVQAVKSISVLEVERAETLKELEGILREAGFSHNAATAFVAKCKRTRGEPADADQEALADLTARLALYAKQLKEC